MFHIAATLSPQNVAARELTPEGRQNMARRRVQLQNDLAYLAPPETLDGETKDVLYAKQKELEAQIREGMPTDVEMWRGGVGVTDKNNSWHRRTKFMQAAWKNLRRILNPDDRSIDLANIENLRPTAVMPNAAATFDVNAAMPGHLAMTPAAKENWPLGEPKISTPLKQAEEREALEAKIAALEAEKAQLAEQLRGKAARKEILKKQRQEQMAKARAAAQAKRAAVETPLSAEG